MGGSGWGPPRSYAAATDPGGGLRGGGAARGGFERGGRGASQGYGRGHQAEHQQGNERQERIVAVQRQAQEAAQQAQAQARELKDTVLKKKAFLQLKWDLDCNRKHLGKGNMVNILINQQTQRVINDKKGNVNKMLRVSGFTTDDVVGITINEYRPNQVEVMFKDEVEIDINEMESKINSSGFDVSISRFDKAEDFLIVYGLPLTNNVEYVKAQIKEAICPFVVEVTEVKPLVHSDDALGNDFFKGKRNGNWRVKTIPKMGKQIPNYIVVGSREKVMGKVVYSKNAGEKQEMCADCFSTEHFKRDPICPGPVKWSAYCEQFKKEWEKNFLEKEVENVEVGGADDAESRIVELQKQLEESLVQVQGREKDLEVRFSKVKELDQKLEEMEDLKRKVSELNDTNITLNDELTELGEKVLKNKGLEDQVKDLTKLNERLKTKAAEDQVLINKYYDRISENVTQRLRSRSTGAVQMSKKLNIADWRIPSGPHLNLPPDPSVSQTNDLVGTQELTNTDTLEDNDENEFLVEMADITLNSFDEKEGVEISEISPGSPPCHGFEGDMPEERMSDKLSDEILVLENEENLLDEDPLTPKTPKRTRTQEPLRRMVKRREIKNAIGEHPKIGGEILLETLSGKGCYTVYSKKNNRSDDYSYILINSEGDEASFDLKNQTWYYSDDAGDTSSPSGHGENGQ